MDASSLILTVLSRLVEAVPDQPRRILFKGVADFYDGFAAQAKTNGLDWDVRVTQANEDVVGARNDAQINTLVVFYRQEVRERESLNAFKVFTEDGIANELIRATLQPGILPDNYSEEDRQKLNFLLTLCYPAVEQLAAFLTAGKTQAGAALPSLGLFHDPDLHYGLALRSWQARLQDNHQMAVIRWREIVEKAQRNQEARKVLGSERTELVQRAETQPQFKQQVLQLVSVSDAQRILNPPTQLVEALIRLGMRREEAEGVEKGLKRGQVKPDELQTKFADIPEDTLRKIISVYRPLTTTDEPDETAAQAARRVNTCLEGLLLMAQAVKPLPPVIRLRRSDRPEAWLDLSLQPDRRWQIFAWSASSLSETLRMCSTPESESTEIVFQAFAPDKEASTRFSFSLLNLANRLLPYVEIWPDQAIWQRMEQIDPTGASAWSQLAGALQQLREAVDPDWKNENLEEEILPALAGFEHGSDNNDREPNNQVYLLFDLLYLAYRERFESFLDAWLDAAARKWQINHLQGNKNQWLQVFIALTDLGLAQRYENSDGSRLVLPYYPTRLIWYRAVIQQIEVWLYQATTSNVGLEFEAGILADQLAGVDRPRMLFVTNNGQTGQRLMEASSAPFFSIFTPESSRQRSRAPLDRARQKIEQFGRMWQFSLDRLHVAFQPGDSGEEVYRLLVQHSQIEPQSAFRVRAVVNGGDQTAFDRYLFNTGDETTDLLTQNYHESLLPRVEYDKGQLENSEESGSDRSPETDISAHIALLVDAFREEKWGFAMQVGLLTPIKQWLTFFDLVKNWNEDHREIFKQAALLAVPYHVGIESQDYRSLVYVPLNGDQPEYLRLMVDSLVASMHARDFKDGVYYEQVRWDTHALTQLHEHADWVILFDRSLEKSLFNQLAASKVRLIDFYPNLRGGYRLSVSSGRTEAVAWQLAQVLAKYFREQQLDLQAIAQKIIETLAQFASGLLLKTLGGGSLAQELLGLYATYRSLVVEGVFNPERDWLIPLDDYQNWFGRRSMAGRRADLLVLRNPAPERLELLAVESKWYKQTINAGFVNDEFGASGQMHTALRSLRGLFDPRQQRLDRDYWQRTLASLLETAPPAWEPFKNSLAQGEWTLWLDGLVYVHQYIQHNQNSLAGDETRLNGLITPMLQNSEARSLFNREPEFKRLRLKSYPEILNLLR